MSMASEQRDSLDPKSNNDTLGKPKEQVPDIQIPIIPDENLCETCQKIDFINSLRPMCKPCSGMIVGDLASSRISMGSLGRIEQNKACPACRLVLSCINAYFGRELPPRAAKVTLEQGERPFDRHKTTEASDKSGLQCVMASLEVRVCSHGLDNGSERDRDDMVGAILPLALDESISGTSAGIEQEPFSIDRSLYHFGLTPRDTGNFANVNLMQKWLQSCLENHGSTCGNRLLVQTPETPIRLIDVDGLKLVEATLQVKYVALSYVWGADAKPMLTKSNEHSLSVAGGISRDNIPRTIGDAIDFTRQLGLRYLWVDTACILQDDENDKQNQLPLMDSIYNCAELVLIAASSNGAYSGIPGIGNRRSAWYRPVESIQGYSYTTVLPQLSERLDASLWNTRGWTFQEGLVARRLLISTDEQMYWNCRTASWSEDRFTEFRNMHPRPRYEGSIFGPILARSCHGLGMRNTETSDDCHLLNYTGKAERFTLRKFKNTSDTLWAFVGVLRMLKPHFPNGYIWGIPDDALDAMLLWDVDCGFRDLSAVHTLPEDGNGFRQMVFPSWTWLTKGCNVHYDSCGAWIESKVIWHDPIRYGENDQMTCTCKVCGKKLSPSSILPSIGPPKWKTDNSISDFGYLHFDVPVAILNVRFLGILPRPRNCEHTGSTLGLAQIVLADGSCIGLVKVPLGMFLRGSTDEHEKYEIVEHQQAEFIHLSTHKRAMDPNGNQPVYCNDDHLQDNEQDGWHAPGCKYAENVNLMLIRWDEDHKIAYRVALTRIQESEWLKVETHTSRIILG